MASLAGAMSKIADTASKAGEAASGLGGALNSAAPVDNSNLTYDGLKGKYLDFTFPMAEIVLAGATLSSEQEDLVVNDIHVELSAGFEASVATFRIYNTYDANSGQFKFEAVKSQVLLGNPMTIKLGYLGSLETVFVGFVAGVAFCYEQEGLPYIEVAGMDLKGIMMGGGYAAQCTATTYSGAVSEILKRTGYEKLKSSGGVVGVKVDSTPDSQAGGKVSDYTVELVSESDYEFVVKAAKKFNYEFFVDRGMVLFRKAKSNTDILATLGSGRGIVTFRVEYSITGIVGAIEARAMDAGEGTVIKASGTYPGPGESMSTGGAAKSLVGEGKKVYIDPTIKTQTQAQARVDSLKEKMSYRLGMLEGECVGIPELVPGRFIRLEGLGTPVDNSFYLETVVHEFTSDNGYRTQIVGRANKVETGAGGLL